MAQPSVAREPSMEEILASIRRIIESNDPAAPDALSAHLPPVYDGEEEYVDEGFSAEPLSPPAHVPPAANQGYGARQQADVAPSFQREEQAVAHPAENSMSLADVAARVRAAADRNAAMGPQAFSSQRQVDAVPSQPAFQPERVVPSQRPTDVRPLMAAAAVQPREVPPAPPASAFPSAATQVAEPVAHVPTWERMELRGGVEPEKAVVRPVEASAEAPVPMPSKSTEESALSLNLISAAAGAQIARSFGELAEVFDGVQRPTIEQMAQDMLRPMLQEWLEDNLPTLVERLVREEIERVARGPRR